MITDAFPPPHRHADNASAGREAQLLMKDRIGLKFSIFLEILSPSQTYVHTLTLDLGTQANSSQGLSYCSLFLFSEIWETKFHGHI